MSAEPHVLVVGTAYHGLTAVESAAAVAAAWQDAAAHTTVTGIGAAEGGPGFLDAVEASVPTTRRTVRVGGAALTYLLTGSGPEAEAYVEAAEAMALTGALDTEPVGRLVGAILDAGVRRIVAGVGGLRTLDGGAGFLRGLAADVGDDDIPAQIRVARERLRGVRLTGVADADRGLLGFQGAAAAAQESAGLTLAESQAAEQRMGDWVDLVRSVIPARRDLMTGKVLRDDRVSGAGAGGGLGYGLLIAGGAVVTGPQWWAAQCGLDERIAAADLVVVVQEVYDWQVLEASVLRAVSDAAARLARPAIVIADVVDVGRREVMTTGLAGAYAVTANPLLRDTLPDPATARTELTRLAARLAGTWTPARLRDVP